MIHVVTSATHHLYPRQLDQMFRMRHRFYIEGHGWSGLSSRNGRETDEFDGGDVVYLLSLDAWGDVAASVRLNPGNGPTLLAKFADHSDEPIEASPLSWDVSRWIAAPQHRRGDGPRWPSNHQRELIVGMLEFALSRGAERFTMLAELRLAERVASYGWPVRMLGAPRAYEGGKGMAVAAEIAIGPHVLALTRQKTSVFATVLFEAPSAVAAPPSPASLPEEAALLAGEIGPARLQRLITLIAGAAARRAGRGEPEAIELARAVESLLIEAGSPVEASPVDASLFEASRAAPGPHAPAGARAGPSAS